MPNNVILKTTNLQKSFSGIIAAEDINITVKESEIIGIIGANGAGKTVFVNMITGYLKPTSGTIEFDNQDITGIKPRDATHIGVCRSFQVSQVCPSRCLLPDGSGRNSQGQLQARCIGVPRWCWIR